MDAHGRRRVDVLRAHEPARLVGANGDGGQVEGPQTPPDLLQRIRSWIRLRIGFGASPCLSGRAHSPSYRPRGVFSKGHALDEQVLCCENHGHHDVWLHTFALISWADDGRGRQGPMVTL